MLQRARTPPHTCGRTSLAWVDRLRHVGLRRAHAFLRESTGGLKEQVQGQSWLWGHPDGSRPG